MEMKNLFYIGMPHHEIHQRYYKNVLGGEYLYHNSNTYDTKFDMVIKQDGPDVVWFFPNIYLNLHPHLKGKQVFTGHGLGFKPWLMEFRVISLKNYFTQIWGVGNLQEIQLLEAGIPKSKILPIGYTLPFLLPHIEIKPNSVLFSFVEWEDFGEFENLIKILSNLDPAIDAYVTLHPSLEKEKLIIVTKTIEVKSNITLLKTQDELMQATSFCSVIVGSSSSVLTPFFYLNKPVIYIRGRLGRNPFRGWGTIKKKIGNSLFNQILEESSKFSTWKRFNLQFMKNARVAPSAAKIFYPSNYSEADTVTLIKNAYSMLL